MLQQLSVFGSNMLFCSVWSGRGDSDKIRQLEEKIQSLTKDLHNVQATLRGMNNSFQEETGRKPGLSGGSGGSIGSGGGGRNPADAAQPEIKEMIHSIQTKLDQLDNRTQVTGALGRFTG